MVSNRTKSYLMLLTVAAIWGAASPIIKFTLGGIDPLPFLAYRFAISAIFSILFFARKIKRGKQFKHFRAHFPIVLLYGILAVPVALMILFFGLDETTVLDLTLISIMGPMLVTAGGAYFFKDKITKREKTGIAIVLVGVIFNSLYPIFKSESVRFTGNLLLFVYLLSDASSVLIAKKMVRKKVKSANLTNLAFITGAVVLIPLTLLTYKEANLINIIINLPLKYHLGVWYMALLSGNLAYFLYVRGQRSIEVSEATLFNYLQPVFTIPLAIFWLGEKLSTSFVVGAIIIAGGLIIAERKDKRYNTH